MSERFQLLGGIYMALIENDHIFLLQRTNTHYRNGYWNMPGGHIEEDENPEDAAQRECVEEAGVKVDLGDMDFGYALFRRGYGGKNRTYADYLFIAKQWAGTPCNKEPQKASQGAWFKLNALPELMIETQRHMLEDYLRGNRYSAVMENEAI